MSIYRSHAKRPAEDANVPVPGSRAASLVPGARPTAGASAGRDWASVRKSSPANFMLPASLKWFAALPFDTRPMALVTQYPRIANLLALQWTKPSACRAYFDDLLVDRRGGRRGFPPDVQRDLFALHEYHLKRYLTLED